MLAAKWDRSIMTGGRKARTVARRSVKAGVAPEARMTAPAATARMAKTCGETSSASPAARAASPRRMVFPCPMPLVEPESVNQGKLKVISGRLKQTEIGGVWLEWALPPA
jgi:hypothetical protein